MAMRSWKIVLCVLVVVAMSFPLYGAKKGVPGVDRPIRILYVTWGHDAVAQQEMTAGAKIPRPGLKVEVLIEDNEWKLEKEISILETYLTQDIDAIVVSVIDPKALEPMFARYKERGIWCLATAGQVANQDLGFITDETRAGLLAGQKLKEWWPKSKPGEKVRVFLAGMPNTPNVEAKINGLRQYVKENKMESWVTFVQEENSNGNLEESMKVATPAFTAHPDMNFIWGVNVSSVLGAYKAARELGLDKVCAVGMGGEASALAELVKPLGPKNTGWVFEIAYAKNFAEYGYSLITSAIYLVQKGTTKGAPPIDIGHVALDRETVQKFIDDQQDWRKRAGLPPLKF
jgi:ribose transport system substrate-binding protein